MKSEQRWLALLLLACFIFATAFSMLNPLGESPDEADHWAYIVHLANERRLPIGPKITQSKHPPLYHATAALFASLGQPTNDFLFANPDIQIAVSEPWSPNFFIHTAREDFPWQGGVLSFHLARFWSVLLSTLTIWAAFRLARIAFPQQPWLGWGCAGILAFLPEFLFIGSSVNNDNGVALLGTLLMLAGITLIKHHHWQESQFGWQTILKRIWWIPITVGGGLLTKVSSMGLWPALSFAIFWATIQQPLAAGQPIFLALWKQWKQWIGLHLFIFGGGLLIASPWLMRNLTLYGDPLGIALVRQTIDLRTTSWTFADTVWLLRGWSFSFIGKFGGAGHIPLPNWIYAGYGLLTFIGFMGLFRAIFYKITSSVFEGEYRMQTKGMILMQAFRQRGCDSSLMPLSPALARVPSLSLKRLSWIPILFFTLAILGVGVAMWRYSLLALGTDQGRLLYPALVPIILCIVLGLVTFFPEHWAKSVVLVGIGWSVTCTIIALWMVLVPLFGPPPPADKTELEYARLNASIRYAELELIGWTLESQSPTLYWRLEDETAHDLRIIMRIVAEDGTLIWEKRRSPGRGLFSTDRWSTKYIMRDIYSIQWPEWASAGRYRVELGVQPYGQALIRAASPVPDADYQSIGWIEKQK